MRAGGDPAAAGRIAPACEGESRRRGGSRGDFGERAGARPAESPPTRRLWRGMIELAAEADRRAERAPARGRGRGSASSASGGSARRSAATSGRCSRGAGELDEAEAVLDEAIAIEHAGRLGDGCEVLAGRAFVASARGEHEEACELGATRRASSSTRSEYLTMQQECGSALRRDPRSPPGASTRRAAILARARGRRPQGLDACVVDRVDELARRASTRRSPPTLSRCRKSSTSPTRSPPSWRGWGTSVLDALRDRLGCTIRLRGNQLTLDGDEPRSRRRAR